MTSLTTPRGDITYQYNPRLRAEVGRNQFVSDVGGTPERFAGPVRASYRASRLTFKRDAIEPLALDDTFEVITPFGTFAMTKADFHRVFPNVLASASYRDGGNYNYRTVPRAAMGFLLPDSEPGDPSHGET